MWRWATEHSVPRTLFAVPHPLLRTLPHIVFTRSAIEARPNEKAATWALQSVPFPPNFPPLELSGAADTPPLRTPQCLAFFLQSRLSLHSPHVLVAVSCNRQLMPIKVRAVACGRVG